MQPWNYCQVCGPLVVPVVRCFLPSSRASSSHCQADRTCRTRGRQSLQDKQQPWLSERPVPNGVPRSSPIGVLCLLQLHSHTCWYCSVSSSTSLPHNQLRWCHLFKKIPRSHFLKGIFPEDLPFFFLSFFGCFRDTVCSSSVTPYVLLKPPWVSRAPPSGPVAPQDLQPLRP